MFDLTTALLVQLIELLPGILALCLLFYFTGELLFRK